MMDNTQARQQAREIAEEAIRQGNPTGWFEELYARAQGDPLAIPWANMEPNQLFTSWAMRMNLQGTNQKALQVGCGLGDDAEELAQLGYTVTAFDISGVAIDWCRKRFPDSSVNYTVADLFKIPREWYGSFDFILEIYTLQSLPQEIRARAMECIATCLAPNGKLVVICRGRESSDPAGDTPPWPLTRQDLMAFQRCGLEEAAFEDFMDQEVPPVRRFRVFYRK
jgi:2-polyprenyl-3-methyl-5-hydroxy-6-metoxy-1,4-benzoquinol methylase